MILGTRGMDIAMVQRTRIVCSQSKMVSEDEMCPTIYKWEMDINLALVASRCAIEAIHGKLEELMDVFRKKEMEKADNYRKMKMS